MRTTHFSSWVSSPDKMRWIMKKRRIILFQIVAVFAPLASIAQFLYAFYIHSFLPLISSALYAVIAVKVFLCLREKE